jgi:hypothetical protein
MKKLFSYIVLWILVLVAIGTALLYVESDLLWKVQQYNLFLYSSLFFKQTMIVPGGMLSYLGAFFTQFFYYPSLGVVMLCGWWLLLMWLTKRTFRISDGWCIVPLIPIAILLTANTELGYWVYFMKLRGYFFVPTIGTTVAVALLWAYRKLTATNLWLRVFYIVMVIVIGYPLMGVYALAAVLLMAVWTWRLTDKYGQCAIISGATLLALLAIPLFYYRFVYYQTNLINIYRPAVPEFTIIDSYPDYKIPYYLLVVCFLVFVVAYKKNVKKKDRKPLLRWAVQGALLAALVYGVWHYWYKDDNFHHELRMQRCMEQADWEGILTEGTKQQAEPTRAIVMIHNLALSRLGRQCDEMYNFRRGSKRSNSPLPVYMYNTAGLQIYYQYGVLNESHRLCMENGVNYGWNVELLQYLTRCALLGGEKQVVRKYLTILRQTQFFGSWADHIEQLLNNPEQLAQDPETGPVTHMLHYVDHKGSDNGYVEKTLMTMLSKTDSDDPYFQEQAVLGALWTRNPDDFWPRMSRYAELHPEGVPRIFMEAACLFGHMQNLDFIKDMPNQDILRSFNDFMQQLEQNKDRSLTEIRKILYPQFGNTYYFEYFFLKDITYF